MRLDADANTRPFLTFFMLQAHLRPGYDYLVARKLPSLWRELPRSGIGSQVAARLLIQTGRPLDGLRSTDLEELAAACGLRASSTPRSTLTMPAEGVAS